MILLSYHYSQNYSSIIPAPLAKSKMLYSQILFCYDPVANQLLKLATPLYETVSNNKIIPLCTINLQHMDTFSAGHCKAVMEKNLPCPHEQNWNAMKEKEL